MNFHRTEFLVIPTILKQFSEVQDQVDLMKAGLRNQANGILAVPTCTINATRSSRTNWLFLTSAKLFQNIFVDVKKLILWESSCSSISPEIVVVWLIDSDEKLLAAKSNWFAVNRIFSGRRFAGCLPFIKFGQGGVFRKADASRNRLRRRQSKSQG